MKATNHNTLIRITALLSLIGALGLLAWWFMMPVFLPVAEAATQFQQMILDNDWISVNLLGLVSTILLTLGFPGFYFHGRKLSKWMGIAGLLLTLTGLILFVSIQYYETLLWPAAASADPELVAVNGVLVKGDKGVVAGLLASGAFLGLGYILFGISSIRNTSMPRLPLWFLMAGALVFGNGILFPLRTLGLILLCSGTIWLAIHIRREESR